MSVVTRAAAKADAVVVRDEVVAGANTATRVGGLIEDIVDSVVFAAEVSSAIRAEAMSDSDVATLSGLATTIDGYLFDTDSETAFLTGQTDPIENGLWLVHSGAWTRPDGYAAGASASGTVVRVVQGTTYADQVWACTTDPPNDVVGTDGTDWQQIAGQSLAATLAIGSTTTLGQTITWTGASANAVLGASTNIPGGLVVSRSGGGVTGVELANGSDIVTLYLASGATLATNHASGLTIEAVAASLRLDSPTVSVTQGVLALGSTPATTGAIRHANNTGAYVRNAGNTQNARVYDVTSGDILRFGDGLYTSLQIQTASTTTFSVFGTNVAIVRSAEVELQSGMGLDWAGTTATLTIAGTTWLTSTTSLTALSQSLSLTATGATVASAGTLRTSATYTHKSRNAGNTADADIITMASDVLTIGEDTDIADVRIRALTSVELYAAGAMVAEAEAGVFQLQGSNKLDWVTSAVLSIGGTNIATSTTSLWSFAQAVSVTSSAASVASTGEFRTRNNFTFYARNNANTQDIRVLNVGTGDSVNIGDATQSVNLVLTSGTGEVLIQRASTSYITTGSSVINLTPNATTVAIVRTTELELASTMGLDFAGELKITRAGTDRITSNSTATIITGPNGVAIGSAPSGWNSLVVGLFIPQASVNPTAGPTTGFYLYGDASTNRPMCWPAGDPAAFEIAPV